MSLSPIWSCSSLGISGADLTKMLDKYPRIVELEAKKVVDFLRENGFSEKQIARMTMKRPQLYMHRVKTNILPKLEYFKSMGVSEVEVARMLVTEPSILERSLENCIMPCIEVLRRFLGDDVTVVKAIRACHYVFVHSNLEKVLEPNISVMVNHGVPKSLISKMILFQPRAMLQHPDKLNQVVNDVKALGFVPDSLMFVLAVRTMLLISRTRWEQKIIAFRSFGLSNDEISLAFKLQPFCMTTSVSKIRKLMSFFLSKLNMQPSMVSKNPGILLLSLEKRIIPRCSVLQILMSKQLIKRDFNLFRMLKIPEKMFMNNVVSKHQDVVPEVVEAYQGKTEFQGFPKDSNVYGHGSIKFETVKF